MSLARLIFLWFISSFIIGATIALVEFFDDVNGDIPSKVVLGLLGAGAGVILLAPVGAIVLVLRDIRLRRK